MFETLKYLIHCQWIQNNDAKFDIEYTFITKNSCQHVLLEWNVRKKIYSCTEIFIDRIQIKWNIIGTICISVKM